MKLRREDLEERFIRSPGPGGQHVNKAATGVWLRHRPTGISVKCTVGRSQEFNRTQARLLLEQKIVASRNDQERLRQARVELERRRKRGRSKAGKERVLSDKKMRSAIKSSRRRVDRGAREERYG